MAKGYSSVHTFFKHSLLLKNRNQGDALLHIAKYTHLIYLSLFILIMFFIKNINI